MTTLDDLLRPLSAEDPAGPDLDDEASFDSLYNNFEQRFRIDTGVAEMAGADLDGEPASLPDPVNWSEVKSSLEDYASQTRDIFVAVSYARVGLALKDMPTLVLGLQYTAQLLQEDWDAMHPKSDSIRGDIGRSNTCRELARRSDFTLPFLAMPLITVGRTAFSGSEFVALEDDGVVSSPSPQLLGVIGDASEDDVAETAAQLDAVVESFEAIDAAFRSNDGSVDFAESIAAATAVRDTFREVAGLNTAEVSDEGEGEDAEGASGEAAGGGRSSASGEIRSREDVLQAFGRIEGYYAKYEPAHPLRVSLGRMKSWVGKDFLEILEDMLPDSLEDAKKVLLERQVEE